MKIKLGNEKVEAVPVRAISSSELWNEYLLEDGSVIKIKNVLTKVVRVDGRYDADGNPLYITTSASVMVVTSPENLIKKDEEEILKQ